MKKFKSLGKLLSRTEQKRVIGGDYDDEILPCGTGRVAHCWCGQFTGTYFYCCTTCNPDGFDKAGCASANNCTTENLHYTSSAC